MPEDVTFLHLVAIGLLFAAWGSYSPILAKFGRGTLNVQLDVVRRRWMQIAVTRSIRVPDAILVGHIINAVAFFGSATLIVMAGLVGAVVNLGTVHLAVISLPFVPTMSIELFALKLGTVALVIVISFFSFTYALRKLNYVLALVGSLPEADAAPSTPGLDAMVENAATVLTEAVKSFNTGIRGYYFAVAALFLFAGPLASILATAAVMALLVWRQTCTRTARAIGAFVDALGDREAGSR